jgi:hypothetical protein
MTESEYHRLRLVASLARFSLVALCVAASACGRIGYDAREVGRADGGLDSTSNLDSSSEFDGGTTIEDVPLDRRIEGQDGMPPLDEQPMTCPVGTAMCGRDCADLQRDVLVTAALAGSRALPGRCAEWARA